MNRVKIVEVLKNWCLSNVVVGAREHIPCDHLFSVLYDEDDKHFVDNYFPILINVSFVSVLRLNKNDRKYQTPHSLNPETSSTSRTKSPKKMNVKQYHTKRQKQYIFQGSTKTLNKSESVENMDIKTDQRISNLKVINIDKR